MLRSDYQLSSPVEADKLHLSMGRWEYYKQMQAPEFLIGLNRNNEAVLDQVALKKVKSSNVKPMSSGDLQLLKVVTMIELANDCYSQGKDLNTYLSLLA